MRELIRTGYQQYEKGTDDPETKCADGEALVGEVR